MVFTLLRIKKQLGNSDKTEQCDLIKPPFLGKAYQLKPD